MSTEPAVPSQAEIKVPPALPRLVLGIAAGIALLAVVIGVWKQRDSPALQREQSLPAPTSDMISKLEVKLKANPNDAEGWRMLGFAYFEAQQYAESATAYGRATQIKPGKADHWSSLGEAKVLAGPGDISADAKAAFTKALALDPKDPRARYFIGVAKDMAGDHRGAIDDWLALLRDTPSGAPWEADVRRIITDVATREKIDVGGKLTSPGHAQASGSMGTATAAIPGPTAAEMRQAAQLPKGQQDAMIEGMVNGLEAKLATSPENLNGWIMLMRSRMQLGQTAKANAALAAARQAFIGDAAGMMKIETAAKELGIAH